MRKGSHHSAETKARISVGMKGKQNALGAKHSAEFISQMKLTKRNFRHGHSSSEYRSPTYRSWDGIKNRCLNSNSSAYPRYGGRGIMVCERWMSFENFLEDMGERNAGEDIHRLDNDGDYELGNCVWMPHGAHSSYHRREDK